MKAVAVMQPTYLPWLGYFALLDRVDVFAFLDIVQFDHRSWQQRNRIAGAAGPQMLTVPVLKKGARSQRIADVLINPTGGYPAKHIRAMEHAYTRAAHIDPYVAGLTEIMQGGHERLADLTIDLIGWLSIQLGIETHCVRCSSLDATGKRADLLADICRRLGADLYVSPPGARVYLDKSRAFDDLGIPVVYNDYEHPTYPQCRSPFAPYMSIVDLLLNVGPESLAVIRGGQR